MLRTLLPAWIRSRHVILTNTTVEYFFPGIVYGSMLRPSYPPAHRRPHEYCLDGYHGSREPKGQPAMTSRFIQYLGGSRAGNYLPRCHYRVFVLHGWCRYERRRIWKAFKV